MHTVPRIDTTMTIPTTPELQQNARWSTNDTRTPEFGNSPTSPFTPYSPQTPISPTTPLKDNWCSLGNFEVGGLDSPCTKSNSGAKLKPNSNLSRQSSLRRTTPTKVGSLTIGRQIGSGSFSKIYEAHGMQGIFAVKTRLSSTSEELFAHEGSVLTKLAKASDNKHPAIVHYYPELSDSDHFVLKMYETSLDTLVRSPKYKRDENSFEFYDYRVMIQPIVGLECWIDWAQQLIEGLKFIHSQNIVHADLKPDNVLVRDRKVAISDFSGAIDLDSQQTSLLRKDLDEGFAWSPVFTDPELRSGSKLPSFGSDIYALGLVLAFCATGQEPFSTAKNATQRLLWMDKMSPMDSFDLDVQQNLKLVRPVIELLLNRSWEGVDEALDKLASEI